MSDCRISSVMTDAQHKGWSSRGGSASKMALLLGNQLFAQGEPDQAGYVKNIQTLHQFGAMIFDRLGAHFEDQRNGFGGLTLRDELQNLALAVGELFKLAAGQRDLLGRKFFDQLIGNFAAEIDFASGDARDGGLELGNRRLL